MDERPAPSNPRKRHRTEDISGCSYRQSHSTGMSDSRNARMRFDPQHGDGDDVLIPSSADVASVALEPLHPPIPNFSAISQAAPKPHPVGYGSSEPQGSMVYNIALPLPNPGRAHRFCQACDHVSLHAPVFSRRTRPGSASGTGWSLTL